ncbi:hypothetical protein JX265_001422 [Neoarthrinium moseri]|uniref:GH16 domain-containing protein n=1 Tax=Neoarthrinium moseri TaxID=1658444 RepID=A0A9P9WV39_9PEZI|nr:hypothetical protein JX265_001422 [Neoarthrinium moseri]
MYTMEVLLHLIVCLAISISKVHADDQLVQSPSKDNSDTCGCYLINGPDAGYFQYHRFWDFRDIPNDGSNDFTTAPPTLGELQAHGGQSATSAYLDSSSWNSDWSYLDGVSSSSPNSPFPNIYSKQNVYISRNTTDGAGGSTFLTLRAARLDSFMSSSQITSQQQNLLHASIRARLRVIPNGLRNSSAPSASARLLDNLEYGSNSSHPVDQGAVVGLFTYESDTQESDIELLTQDTTDQIWYSNQPDYDNASDRPMPGASTHVTLPNGLVWTEWIEHRLDWFDGVVRWWANDTLVLNKSINAPSQPSGLMLNVWGDGGYWSGNMSVGGEVTVGIEWIQVVFNVSGSAAGPSGRSLDHTMIMPRDDMACNISCSVDGVKQVGYPEVTFHSGGGRSRPSLWAGDLSKYALGLFILVLTVF